MKFKPAYIALIACLLLAIGIGFAAFQQYSVEPQSTTITTVTPSIATSDNAKSTRLPLAKGQYINYGPGIIESTRGTKLLFFHASWCRQCQEIDASIVNQGVPNGVSIIKVDYDSSHELRKKYSVTLQTTFVRINNNGDLINKFVAYNEPTFDSVRRELL